MNGAGPPTEVFIGGAERAAGGSVLVVDYDPLWPALYTQEAAWIASSLGPAALLIEHVGSTSVPGLAAKPVIDINVAVTDSADELAYAPGLEALGYELCVREPAWFEHRLFQLQTPRVNVHVFTVGCPEAERMRAFRDRLRAHPDDREIYARTKRDLAAQRWRHVQDYADAKTGIVTAIMNRPVPHGPRG